MSNLLRTIQQVTRDYVDSISHRLPSIKNGTVTATSSDGTAAVRVDGDTATTASVPSIASVKTGDRVKMVLFNRQLTILGAIQTRQHDSGWVRIVPADSTYYTSNAYVRRIGDIVQVRGNLARSDSENFQPGWTPGIIPAGYRPLSTSVFICAGANVTGSNAYFKVSINASDGIITIRANPSASNSLSVYLDGISWPIA